MHSSDSETLARTLRYWEICRQLTELVALSMDQRRTIDRLLTKLEEVAARAGLRPAERARGAGPSAAGAGRPTARPGDPNP